MTIREMQYAIQAAIDEKNVADNAEFVARVEEDGTIVFYALEHTDYTPAKWTELTDK